MHKSARDYWMARKERDAKRKSAEDKRKVLAIRAHVCGAGCGPCCTYGDS